MQASPVRAYNCLLHQELHPSQVWKGSALYGALDADNIGARSSHNQQRGEPTSAQNAMYLSRSNLSPPPAYHTYSTTSPPPIYSAASPTPSTDSSSSSLFEYSRSPADSLTSYSSNSPISSREPSPMQPHSGANLSGYYTSGGSKKRY